MVKRVGLASSVGSRRDGGDGWLFDTGELCALRVERPGYEPDSTPANEGLLKSWKSSLCGRLREVDRARWLRAKKVQESVMRSYQLCVTMSLRS